MIRPLTGHALVEVKPLDAQTESGLYLVHDNQKSLRCIVRAIGPWPQKNGHLMLPDFGVGAEVVIPWTIGQKVKGISRWHKLVKTEDVLAVLTES